MGGFYRVGVGVCYRIGLGGWGDSCSYRLGARVV